MKTNKTLLAFFGLLLTIACGNETSQSSSSATATPTPTPVVTPTPTPTPNPNEILNQVLLGLIDIDKTDFRFEAKIQINTISNFGSQPFNVVDNEVFEVEAFIPTVNNYDYTNTTRIQTQSRKYVPVNNGYGSEKIVIDFLHAYPWHSFEAPVVFKVCRKDQNPNDNIIIETKCSEIWAYRNRDSQPIALPN